MFEKDNVDTQVNLLQLEGADWLLVENFLSAEKSKSYFKELKEGVNWEQHYFSAFGKKIAFPRLTAWYGEPGAVYTYSHTRLEPFAWTPLLEEIKRDVEKRIGQRFNSVLLNYYRDGRDSVSWHSDDEKELGDKPVIASLSLGATRTFSFRRKDKSTVAKSVELSSGSLLIMKGTTQQYWQHALPKRKAVSGARINLTFRNIFS